MPAINKLPRIESLKSRREIERLLKNGRRFSGRFSIVIWEQSENFRFAVLLSGNIKPAAYRNRLKRLLREAVRLNRNVLSRPVTVALMVRSIKNEPEFEDINSDIADAFKNINQRQA